MQSFRIFHVLQDVTSPSCGPGLSNILGSKVKMCRVKPGGDRTGSGCTGGVDVGGTPPCIGPFICHPGGAGPTGGLARVRWRSSSSSSEQLSGIGGSVEAAAADPHVVSGNRSSAAMLNFTKSDMTERVRTVMTNKSLLNTVCTLLIAI